MSPVPRLLRFGVTSKLFLAILATCIAVTIAMGMAVRISFDLGFKHYISQRETRRAEAITAILSDYYRETGHWDELREQPRRWWRLLRSIPDTDATQSGRPPSAMPFIPPPYGLIDAHQHPVVSTSSNAAPDALLAAHNLRYAITVDERTVGWLVAPPRVPVPGVIDEQFAAQQIKATWLISALSVLIAALVSVLLARSLIAPLRRLGQATHRLAGGDYGTRVAVGSRDELGQLAHDFNHLALTLERNEGMRRDMVADISHELRTPLAILKGELEALQDGVRALTPASLTSLQAEVATLNKLIDDLYQLSLADVGAMHYRMTRVDVGGLLSAVCTSYHDRLAARGLTLQTHIPPQTITMHGDPQRLTQLFNNLLENALRYTDSGGLVRVTLGVRVDELQISVEDTAPGVPEELLPRLFERMFRVEPSRSRESGGSGLGLALATHIVQAHAGRIQALPCELGGLRIDVYFARQPFDQEV